MLICYFNSNDITGAIVCNLVECNALAMRLPRRCAPYSNDIFGFSGNAELLLYLPQFPPRHPGRLMMFVMITEKITAKKSEKMVAWQTTGLVLVIMLSFVGQ